MWRKSRGVLDGRAEIVALLTSNKERELEYSLGEDLERATETESRSVRR